jgi:hypothetical protein
MRACGGVPISITTIAVPVAIPAAQWIHGVVVIAGACAAIVSRNIVVIERASAALMIIVLRRIRVAAEGGYLAHTCYGE